MLCLSTSWQGKFCNQYLPRQRRLWEGTTYHHRKHDNTKVDKISSLCKVSMLRFRLYLFPIILYDFNQKIILNKQFEVVFYLLKSPRQKFSKACIWRKSEDTTFTIMLCSSMHCYNLHCVLHTVRKTEICPVQNFLESSIWYILVDTWQLQECSLCKSDTTLTCLPEIFPENTKIITHMLENNVKRVHVRHKLGLS